MNMHYPPKWRNGGSITTLTTSSSLWTQRHQTFACDEWKWTKTLNYSRSFCFFPDETKLNFHFFSCGNLLCDLNKTQTFVVENVKQGTKLSVTIFSITLKGKTVTRRKNKITFNTYYNGLNQRLKWNNNAIVDISLFFFDAFCFVR